MRANVAAVLVGLLVMTSRAALGCCMGVNDPATEIADSTEVFEGRVIATDHREWARPIWIVEEKLGTTADPVFGRLYNDRITVVVENAWKGSPSRTTTLVIQPGWSFTEGERWLFYVSDKHPGWSDLSLCSRTRPMAFASEDLAVLGAPLKTYRALPFWKARVAVIAGCILLVVLSAIAVMNRRARQPASPLSS